MTAPSRKRKTAAAPPEPPLGTRERVLEAAGALIAERGNAAITLVDVAARAGVSRQTLYLLFGSRAGLLLALVDALDASSAAPARLARLRQTLPAEQALEPYLREWLGYLQVVFPVALALSAAAMAGDTDADAAWQSRARKLRGGFAQITRALRERGRLREGWTPEAAADWMFGLTHVDLWHHLVVECGWKPAAATERIVATLRSVLLVERG